GATVTVNDTPLLARPPTVTTTLPVVAPAGTGTAMLVADHVVGVAAVPLNVTVLVPFVAPKFVPLISPPIPTPPLAPPHILPPRHCRRVCACRREGDSERYPVAGQAPDGDDDVARRCACGHRYGNAGRGPRRRRRGRPVERHRTRTLSHPEACAGDCDCGRDGPTRRREARDRRR